MEPQNTARDTTQPSAPLYTSGSLTESHHHRMGPILGGMLIVLVLILGGLYLWGSTLVENTATAPVVTERIIPNNEPETPRAQADAAIMGTVSPSDELDAIEADLLSTNLDSLELDIATAERELDAALSE